MSDWPWRMRFWNELFLFKYFWTDWRHTPEGKAAHAKAIRELPRDFLVVACLYLLFDWLFPDSLRWLSLVLAIGFLYVASTVLLVVSLSRVKEDDDEDDDEDS